MEEPEDLKGVITTLLQLNAQNVQKSLEIKDTEFKVEKLKSEQIDIVTEVVNIKDRILRSFDIGYTKYFRKGGKTYRFCIGNGGVAGVVIEEIKISNL